MEHVRPAVALLTDGSGKTGVSRVDSTTRLLDAVGASRADFYGEVTDQQCYAALLGRDNDFFVEIAENLADMLVASRIESVVGDASEGWNPIHDIWRAVIDAAVDMASHRLGSAIRNYDFLLFASHSAAAATADGDALVMQLDEAAYERKLASGELYSELHAEVKAAMNGSTRDLVPSPELSAALDARLGGLNRESYRVELLRPVHSAAVDSGPRVYEAYGEMMVAAGRYKEAIRHDRHLAPVEASLRRHTVRETGSLTACAFSSPAPI
jgi:hypothetical protein